MFNSFLDNDYYKFLMQSRIFEIQKNDNPRFKPELPVKVEYRLFNRGNSVHGKELYVNQLEFHKRAMKMIRQPKRLTDQEVEFLVTMTGLKYDYVCWLQQKTTSGFSVDRIKYDHDGPNLKGFSIEGDWLDLILFEVPLMALISEMHFETINQPKTSLDSYACDVKMKKDKSVLNSASFAEYGTRRRMSTKLHKLMNARLRKMDGFLGTSNVYLSMQNRMSPIGTIAHEWFLAHYAQLMKQFGVRPLDALGCANRKAWYNWIGYHGPEAKYGPLDREDLFEKTAVLTDTFGTEVFLRDMHHEIEDIQNFRQDSGDWKRFVELVVGAHKKEGFSLQGKTIMFSDGLNTKKVDTIREYMADTYPEINVKFGIGTYLTNDFGQAPLNIVIKPVSFDGIPVLKISDDPGKITGSSDPSTQDILSTAKQIAEWYNTDED